MTIDQLTCNRRRRLKDTDGGTNRNSDRMTGRRTGKVIKRVRSLLRFILFLVVIGWDGAMELTLQSKTLRRRRQRKP